MPRRESVGVTETREGENKVIINLIEKGMSEWKSLHYGAALGKWKDAALKVEAGDLNDDEKKRVVDFVEAFIRETARGFQDRGSDPSASPEYQYIHAILSRIIGHNRVAGTDLVFVEGVYHEGSRPPVNEAKGTTIEFFERAAVLLSHVAWKWASVPPNRP